MEQPQQAQGAAQGVTQAGASGALPVNQRSDNQAQESEHAIAVDFDATLAEYDHWRGHHHLGEPIPGMVEKVKAALAAGRTVVIYTARVYPGMTQQEMQEATESFLLIAAWCQQHIGQVLPITCMKTRAMAEFWDDRAKQVIPNTGVFLSELAEATQPNQGA